MTTVDDDIREGRERQKAEDWPAALACYSRALSREPDHVQALFLAGVAHAHAGRSAAAGELLERCAALQPDSTAAQSDLGSAYAALNELERAAGCFERAVTLMPEHADVHFNLGNIRKRQGDLEGAAKSYEQAVAISADHARAWHQLGIVRQLQGKNQSALSAYQRALALEPDNAEAENNLGIVLLAEGRLGEAVAAFRRALALKPDNANAAVNLAAALQDENCLTESIAVLETLLASAPEDARALATLGNALLALNRPADAVVMYERVLALDPDSSEIRYNIGLAQLVMGDFENGWAGYEARQAGKGWREPDAFGGPRWHGNQSLAEQTLLVEAEQGLGDTIHFLRYLPLLEARGAHVIVRVQAALRELVAAQSSTVTCIAGNQPVPDHDFQCPLLSLPHEFGTRLESIPASIPYLAAPSAKVGAWRRVFAHAPGMKIGLVWAGNPKHQFDHKRSIPPSVFAGLTNNVPVHFFTLQKEFRPTDQAALAALPHITDLSAKLADFTDTAAVVAALDLVITVDTAVAHLAGALGTRTWVLLGFAPDWRWLLHRSDSPWYPTVRLFRQPEPGEWEPVIRQVRAELAVLAADFLSGKDADPG